MKTAFFTSCVGAIVIAACLTSASAYAGKSTQLEVIKKELRAVTAVEVPAKAAGMVSQAKPETRATTAEEVVSAVFSVRPTVLVAAVHAISQANPDVAAVAAAKAASLLPKKATAIARTAGMAAPTQVAQINAAVSKGVAPTPTAPTLAALPPAVPPPTVGPPFTPAPGSPTEIDRDDTAEVPSNYGQPRP